MSLGFFNYLNSFPIYEGLGTETDLSFEINTPLKIGQKILDNSLQAGQMSLLQFLENKERLNLSSSFCISSSDKGFIKSVLLFSKKPIQTLDNEIIYLTSESQTSSRLLQILCKHKYNIKPIWKIKDYLNAGKLDSVLLIGDQALKACELYKEKYFIYDLAFEWFEWTNLPFVFAVFVTQKDYKLPIETENIFLSNLKRNLIKSNLTKIIKTKNNLNLKTELLLEYFDNIEYNLDSVRLLAINKFKAFVKEGF
jgi:chorismate dehydratase